MSALGLAACQGRTEPASNIHAGGASLRFTGTADNGPAYSYFEYWKTGDSANKLLTRRRDWQGGASGTFPEAVSNLSSSTSYTFRVCGGDRGAPAGCQPTRSFTTLDSDAILVKQGSALEFLAAPGFSQNVQVERTVEQGVARFVFYDGFNNGVVPAPGSGCTVLPGSPTVDRAVRCSAAGITRIRLKLGDQSDLSTFRTDAVQTTIDGGAGNDGLSGSNNRDFIVGGPGNDRFAGEGGDDTINARDGEVDDGFGISCGENPDLSNDNDFAYIDPTLGELPLEGSDENCENVSTATPPAAP